MQNTEYQANSLQQLQADFDKSRGYEPHGSRTEAEPAVQTALLDGKLGDFRDNLDVMIERVRRLGRGDGDRAELVRLGQALVRMSSALEIDLEIALLEHLCLEHLRRQPVSDGNHLIIKLFGPPGSGKTAAASFLANVMKDRASVYIEEYLKNERLTEALSEKMASTAESQMWFLNGYADFIEKHTLKKTIILDQDPLAVPLIYGRKFYDEKALCRVDYVEHLKEALKLQQRFDSVAGRSLVFYIKSAPEILHSRCHDKEFATKQWHTDIMGRFESVFQDVPHVPIENFGTSLDEFCERVGLAVDEAARNFKSDKSDSGS